MESTLTVRNFGPIKNATLNMRNVNVLIGPQASGKSTLAKLYTICKSPSLYHQLENDKFPIFFEINDIEGNANFEKSVEKFKMSLKNFSILDFLNENTYIEFDSPSHKFIFENGTLFFEDKIDIQSSLEYCKDADFENLKIELNKLSEKLQRLNFTFRFNLFYSENHNLGDSFVDEFIKFSHTFDIDNFQFNKENSRIFIQSVKSVKSEIFNSNALYIPSERTIINLMKQAAFSFQKAKVPLPGHLLDYAEIYVKATTQIENYDLSFLKPGTTYKNQNGTDKIFFNEVQSINLTDSASGFQSVVPLLLPIVNEKKDSFQNKHYSFVIEEPETNLFPKAQYELLKFLEKDRYDDSGKIDQGIIHTYTTHSPFVLTALNNMLYAFKKGSRSQYESTKEKISNIIPKENWINPDFFSAYEIKNGSALDIFNRDTGLIDENSIGIISDEIIEDFRNIAIASIENE
jgi:predicted ATPase